MALNKNQNIIFYSARVLKIVLSKFDPLSEEISKIPKGSFKSIGDIQFEFIEGENPKGKGYAKPFNNQNKYYPLINEVVLIAQLPSNEIYQSKASNHWYYMQAPVNIWKNENHNAVPTMGENFHKLYQRKIETYLETERGLSDINKPDDALSDLDIELGNYFKEKGIKGLQPFEGDFLIEGRFGQSIRMGSTNRPNENYWSDNVEGVGDPITIISNGLPDDPLLYKNNRFEDDSIDSPWIQTVEHINADPSSIYLTSNQRIKNFNPSGVGNSSFKAEKITEKTEFESLTEATKYYKTPTKNKIPLTSDVKEDIPIRPPKTIQKMSDNIELDSVLDNIILPERVPYYIIEDTTDSNNIRFTQEVTPVIHDSTQDLNLDQNIGEYFKLRHLIYSPKTEDINYNTTSTQHPDAIFEREGVGFYIDIKEGGSAKGTKTIITKDIDINGDYRILTKYPTIPPLTFVSPYTYTKNDTELLREAEAHLFGNFSQYGVASYPGVDLDISKEEIIENLNKLAINCIDPIISQFGSNVRIVSAYRSKKLNSLLKGNPSNSEHIYGYAADIRLNSTNNQGLFNWCADNLEFQNLLWAFPERKNQSWVHISYIEGRNNKNTTLASEYKLYHNSYKETKRGRNKNYQDNIKKAITPPNI